MERDRNVRESKWLWVLKREAVMEVERSVNSEIDTDEIKTSLGVNQEGRKRSYFHLYFYSRLQLKKSCTNINENHDLQTITIVSLLYKRIGY